MSALGILIVLACGTGPLTSAVDPPAGDVTMSVWRSVVQFSPGPESLTVRLTSNVWVRGRVVRFGVPLAGARVDVPPDLDAYARAVDPYDVVYDGVAGETVTGRDGRFEIALPPGSATEVRITFQRVTARRPVAQSGPGTIDLGDIELPAVVRLSLTYVGDEWCQLLAAGPFGGLALVTVEAKTDGPSRWRLRTLDPGP
jgi:hypothetical protein